MLLLYYVTKQRVSQAFQGSQETFVSPVNGVFSRAARKPILEAPERKAEFVV